MTRPAFALLVLLAACDAATPPERAAAYDYTIRIQSGFPIVFRWPAASLPVRIWTEPVLDLEWHVATAIATWESGVLFGEVRGVIVDDSTRADVIIRVGAPQDVVMTSERLACAGTTLLEVDLDTAIVLPFRTYVAPRVGTAGQDVQECLHTVVAHELGHSLGLFLHSDDPDDLMHQRPTSESLSQRDRATLETLYHSAPTVHLPPGR